MKKLVIVLVVMVMLFSISSATSAFTRDRLSGAEDFIVSNTNDSGPGSLRQAILDTNAKPGKDRISFDITAAPTAEGMYIILVDSLLPAVTDPVVIDGSTQPGYSKSAGPIIEISGGALIKSCSGVESGGYRDNPGLDIVHNSSGNASGTRVKGLKVSNFCQGIAITAGLENAPSSCSSGVASERKIADIVIRDNFLEGNLDGNSALDFCLAVDSVAVKNTFYNNGDHIEVTRSTYVLVENNVGVQAQDGLELVRSHQITVQYNRFSNNRRNGIALVYESSENKVLYNEIHNVQGMGLVLANNNIVIGNTIVGADWFGIEIRGASDNVVSDNIIMGNGLGGIAVGAGTLNGLDQCPTFDENGNPDPTEDCAVQFTVVNPDVQGDAFNNRIENNTIADNLGPGIVVGGRFTDLSGRERSAARNTLSRNIIYNNEGLGIDLSDDIQNVFFIVEEPLLGVFGQSVVAKGDGVTPNNSFIEANDGQNFPVLTEARANPGHLWVEGTIDTDNPQFISIEFFANLISTNTNDPSGHGEAAVFLGKGQPNSQGMFSISLPPVSVGSWITATATDSNGNTSEFSKNIEVQSYQP